MTSESLPLEAQGFRKSQTPESPRPVHLPKPSSIPVLQNQMDPVFNDTATYNIPNQPFSPYPDHIPDSNRAFPEASVEDSDAVQNFFRGADAENARFEGSFDPNVTHNQASQDTITANSEGPSSLSVTHDQNANNQNLPRVPPTPQSVSSAKTPIELRTVDAVSRLGLLCLPQTSADVAREIQDAQAGSSAQTAKAPDIDTPTKPKAENGDNSQGVDYQSLLDTISEAASTAPALEPVAAPTTAASETQGAAQPLPSVPGLPPKPPPQANPPEYETFGTSTEIAGYESAGAAQFPSDQTLSRLYNEPQGVPALTPVHQFFSTGNNTTSFFQPQSSSQDVQPAVPHNRPDLLVQTNQEAPGAQGNTERPWSPSTQSLYDSFLEDERRYVTEGIWDRFPMGSRLFVGMFCLRTPLYTALNSY